MSQKRKRDDEQDSFGYQARGWIGIGFLLIGMLAALGAMFYEFFVLPGL